MRSTTVSKTSPAIRKILKAALGAKDAAGHRGPIVVRELPSTSRYVPSGYVPSSAERHAPDTGVWSVDLGELFGSNRATFDGVPFAVSEPARQIWDLAPRPHEALVFRRKAGIDIVILDDAIDSSAVAVTTDALLARDKKAAQQAASACGVTAELCMALADAHAKALAKGELAGDLTATLVTTSQTPSAKRAKKTAAQLDREIAAALSRR